MLRARLPALAAACLLAACASHDEAYRQAFAAASAPSGNGHVVNVGAGQALTAAKLVLVRQGFAIDAMDASTGIIKASRSMQDYKDANLTYNIAATVDVTAKDSTTSVVSMAASQKSVLHREWHEWWHLLFIIPLFPIDTHYENTVVAEGDVTDPAVYQGFFTSLDANLNSAAAPVAPTPAPAPTMPAAVTATPVAAAAPASTVSAPVQPVAAPAPAGTEAALPERTSTPLSLPGVSP